MRRSLLLVFFCVHGSVVILHIQDRHYLRRVLRLTICFCIYLQDSASSDPYLQAAQRASEDVAQCPAQATLLSDEHPSIARSGTNTGQFLSALTRREGISGGNFPKLTGMHCVVLFPPHYAYDQVSNHSTEVALLRWHCGAI